MVSIPNIILCSFYNLYRRDGCFQGNALSGHTISVCQQKYFVRNCPRLTHLVKLAILRTIAKAFISELLSDTPVVLDRHICIQAHLHSKHFIRVFKEYSSGYTVIPHLSPLCLKVLNHKGIINPASSSFKSPDFAAHF